MSADVEAIRARADAASPLPWKSGWYKVTLKYRLLDEHTAVGGANDVLLASCGKVDDPQSEADAAFIAAARTDVPLLCDELTEARARVAALEAEREGLRARIREATRFLPAIDDDDRFHGMRDDPDGVWINGAHLEHAITPEHARDAGRARGET